MVRTTSSSRYTFTDLLSTIGSGDLHGMHGIVLGTGVITRAGGTFTAAGHTIGTGVTATLGIITTTTARSVRDTTYTTVITSYTAV